MELKIRVGAAIDRSLSEAYRPLIKAAGQARTEIDKSSRQAGAAVVQNHTKAAKAAGREYEKSVREIEKWEREKVRAVQKSARDRQREIEKVEREEIRSADRVARAIERAEKQKTKEVLREAAKRQREASQSFRSAQRSAGQSNRSSDRQVFNGINQAGGLMLGAGRAAAGFAMNVARDLAQGAGVDTDFGSMISKNAALETSATNLSNSGYMAGDSRNTRVDPRMLMGDALALGKETGIDSNAALEGLIKFTGKTGDLATGREIMKDLAMFSKATGTNLDDMVDAAGDVASALGDVPNKGEAIKATMKAIAGQGKLGAVEIRDLASQMAKLAANAGQMEGDVTKNIIMLGGFAQEARQRGGAATATQAATSAAAMMNTFKTPKRAAEFQAATGKSVFNKSGMIRNAEDLVMEALHARGMNPTGFKKIFSNVAGARAVEGYATIYRQHGGGKAGEAAVREEFERMRNAVIADTEILESFQRSLQTTESQAAIFNNSMRESALRIQDNLIPALIELAPHLVRAGNAAANLTTFLVGTEASARTKQHVVSNAVGSALTETKKQIGHGYILNQQLDQNKDAEKLAFENMHRAKAEAEVATQLQADRPSTLGRVAKDALGSTLFGPGYGLFAAGRGVGDAAFTTTKKDVADKDDRARDARWEHDKIKTMSRYIGDLIGQKIIQVRVVEPVPGGSAVPGVSGAGRDPPPEHTAGQK